MNPVGGAVELPGPAGIERCSRRGPAGWLAARVISGVVAMAKSARGAVPGDVQARKRHRQGVDRRRSREVERANAQAEPAGSLGAGRSRHGW